jgi:hypothetical protein
LFIVALVAFLVGCFSGPALIEQQRTWNERQDTATRAEAVVTQHRIGLAEDPTYHLVYEFEAQRSDGTTRTVVKFQRVEEDLYRRTYDGDTVSVVYASANPENAVIEGTGKDPTFRVGLVFFLAGAGLLYCLWTVASAIRTALVKRRRESD